MSDIHEKWCLTNIGELFLADEKGKTIKQGWSPKCESFPAPPGSWGALKTTAIQEGRFLPDENKCLPGHLEPRPDLQVQRDDIVLTCAGPRNRCGIVCRIPSVRSNLMISGKMYRLRVNQKIVDPAYLENYLVSADVQAKIDSMKSGINDSGLNLTKDRFLTLQVPVPPLNEQRRIVAKIEELFSELDKGVESLKTARAQLKTYRQSLLKAAFEGRLTEQWRRENADKLETADQLLQRIREERETRYPRLLEEWKAEVAKLEAEGRPGKKPKKPRATPKLTDLADDFRDSLPALPAEWSWQSIENLVDESPHAIKAGPFGSALKKEFYVPSGYKVYGQEQVIGGDPEYGDYFVSDEKYQELSACSVKARDALISLVGTIGKVLILPWGAQEGVINPRLVKISFDKSIYIPEFFKFYFESNFIRTLYYQASQGTTMNVLNLTIIKSLPYPLCSQEEQQEVVDVLNAKMSEIDYLEAEAEAAIARTNALRQSILKRAFEGKLVPQDPDDEPASVLLERIRQEQADAPRPKPGARKTGTTA